MQVAIELMCPGVPVTAWAIMLPRVSKTPADRSPDSRTTVVNDVRISAVACSLTTEIRRFQRTSRVIGSIVGADSCISVSSRQLHLTERVAQSTPAIRTTRFPYSSTRTLPGPITAVDSRSSTTAGPSNAAPGPNR